MRAMVTHQDWVDVLTRIRGVEKVSLTEQGPGAVVITVRYRIWTYVLPWLNLLVSNRVQSVIDARKPFGTQMSRHRPNTPSILFVVSTVVAIGVIIGYLLARY